MVTIMLDAGHGGKDPGAAANGLVEKNLTLKLALAAGAHLTKHYECNVLYTRTADLFFSPSERARLANKAKADVFCSFHINSSANPQARGFETFRYPNTSGKTAMLQLLVHETVMKQLTKQNVPDRGKKKASFAVVRETAMPAILTETLFISNKKDAELLTSDLFLQRAAAAHAKGIARAAGAKKKAHVPAF